METTEDTKKITDVLDPQEEQFCQAFGNAESETHNKCGDSAKVAGYQNPSNTATRLRKKAKIQRRLKEIYAENASDVGRVMSDLRALQLKAERKGDLQTAATCLKLQGQRYGMFTERTLTLDEEQIDLTEREIAEANKLANIRLAQICRSSPKTAEDGSGLPANEIDGKVVNQKAVAG